MISQIVKFLWGFPDRFNYATLGWFNYAHIYIGIVMRTSRYLVNLLYSYGNFQVSLILGVAYSRVAYSGLVHVRVHSSRMTILLSTPPLGQRLTSDHHPGINSSKINHSKTKLSESIRQNYGT